jgi:hypothetical protein
MRSEKYSKKAREKLADTLFSISTNVASATIITLVIAPLAAVLKALYTPGDEGLALVLPLIKMSPGEGWALLGIYGLAIFIVGWSRRSAMKIYTDLHPDAD